MSPAARTFQCIGVANRGEAALRLIRTVRVLREREGAPLRALALYTDDDADADFVRLADLRLRLEGPAASPVAHYLDADRLVAALRRGGADAVWPGWGFLSEDPAFAERAEAAGLVFLGPRPETLRLLGDKVAAKGLAEGAGVPVIPWSRGAVATADEAVRAARALGLPVMLKAAAGGGGRGIRRCATEEELRRAFERASAEARAAFGDGRLFLERILAAARHLEVQIAGDGEGRVLALGIRDCSVQRRHQKLIEECPAPGLPEPVRRHLEDAARRIGESVAYRGVGTVEFLLAPDAGQPLFLEVNPRLQVEHTVTEEVTGLDLVELQIRIARGEPLPAPPVPRGAAMEARLCAEDPEEGFRPAPGRVVRFEPPRGPGIRVEADLRPGGEVSAAFDPLLAKVIATGRDREEARARLAAALRELEVVIGGGSTNRGFLLGVLAHPEFRRGGVDTAFADALPPAPPPRTGEALLAAAILAYRENRDRMRRNLLADPAHLVADRVPPSSGLAVELDCAGQALSLRVLATSGWRYRVELGADAVLATLHEEGPGRARLRLGDTEIPLLHDVGPAEIRIEIDGRLHRFGRGAAGEVRAGTPGLVVALPVGEGQRVAAGEVLAVIEAMKMETAVRAPFAGRVQRLRVAEGQQVAADALLLTLVAEGTSARGPGGPPPPRLPRVPDPLAPWLALRSGEQRSVPGPPADVDRAVAALRDEVRSALLGYDASPERLAALTGALGRVDPARLPAGPLAGLRHELTVLADVEELFDPTPSTDGSGAARSNRTLFETFVRRLRSAGGGLPADFLDRVARAVAHYGVSRLEPGDALERAALRLLSTRRSADARFRLARAVLGLLEAALTGPELARHLAADPDFEVVLRRLEALRGRLPHELADAVCELRDALFLADPRAAAAERELAAWEAAGPVPGTLPPTAVLEVLAEAPADLFARVRRGHTAHDPARRFAALAAEVRRLYGPSGVAGEGRHATPVAEVHRLDLADGRRVLAASAPKDPEDAVAALLQLAEEAAASPRPRPLALELLVPDPGEAALRRVAGRLAPRLAGAHLPRGTRLALGAVAPGAVPLYRAFVWQGPGAPAPLALHGLHPEVARRVELARLEAFELERLPGTEDAVVFWGHSRELPEDERLFVLAEVPACGDAARARTDLTAALFEHALLRAARALRRARRLRDPGRRLHWNRISLFARGEVVVEGGEVEAAARRLAPSIRDLGIEKIVIRLLRRNPKHPRAPSRALELVVTDPTGGRATIRWRRPHRDPLRPATELERRRAQARRLGLPEPTELIGLLTRGERAHRPEDADARGWSLPPGTFTEYDLDEEGRARPVSGRPLGAHRCGIVFGVIENPTDKHPEGLRRVLILSDPTRDLGALAGPECARIRAALDLARAEQLPVEWAGVSSGARIAFDSGTENLDATAAVARRIVEFTRDGGTIHILVPGLHVGAQSYFDALATMLMHTRGALIMTPRGAMVLTGRTALEASGGVAAEDEIAIGGYERIMGPNGCAHYLAEDLHAAWRLLYRHYAFTYVAPGERGPRRFATGDPDDRPVTAHPAAPDEAPGFSSIGEIFSEETNPGRRRPFPVRWLMHALRDRDGGFLERWRDWRGAETAVVWDAHLGGFPVCLIGIEARNLPRTGFRPPDGPESWTGATLHPLSSRKVARALRASSGNRPAVILANLAGFDGSPESLRRLQLEYGAELARAVVEFRGPLLFAVITRYHGGAYVVFSRALNPELRAVAVRGSYASVIGGAPAAAVVFAREIRRRAGEAEAVRARRAAFEAEPTPERREAFERAFEAERLRLQAEFAARFDAIHTVERALAVGSIESLVEPEALRPELIARLRAARRA